VQYVLVCLCVCVLCRGQWCGVVCVHGRQSVVCSKSNGGVINGAKPSLFKKMAPLAQCHKHPLGKKWLYAK